MCLPGIAEQTSTSPMCVAISAHALRLISWAALTHIWSRKSKVTILRTSVCSFIAWDHTFLFAELLSRWGSITYGCSSLLPCCCVTKCWPQATWGRKKVVFGSQATVYHQGSQGRNRSQDLNTKSSRDHGGTLLTACSFCFAQLTFSFNPVPPSQGWQYISYQARPFSTN